MITLVAIRRSESLATPKIVSIATKMCISLQFVENKNLKIIWAFNFKLKSFFYSKDESHRKYLND